jgi:hypothetical protein
LDDPGLGPEVPRQVASLAHWVTRSLIVINNAHTKGTAWFISKKEQNRWGGPLEAGDLDLLQDAMGPSGDSKAGQANGTLLRIDASNKIETWMNCKNMKEANHRRPYEYVIYMKCPEQAECRFVVARG